MERIDIASDADLDPPAVGLERPVTRRNFIVWYLAGLLTATLVAIVLPLLVYIYPPAGKNKNEELSLVLSTPLDQLAEFQAVHFQAPANSGFVMKDGGGDNYPGKITFAGYAIKLAGGLTVLSSTCSHLGCSVSYNASSHIYACPCHGSRFHANGTVAHGPAVAPLSHLTWSQGSNSSTIKVLGIALPGIG
ncbi:MAG TPA: ubiquinol-cytochrome c reductase iron-sulfur subunit [Candidatus Nitrosotalea sp.]|nr:ubiquinol-cytochrome c reductase iron-sulfur subunit [Candidatus Nitrosotalea sp.]